MVQDEIRHEDAGAFQQHRTGLTPQVRLVPYRAGWPVGRLRREVERVVVRGEAWHPGAKAPGKFAVARSDFNYGFVPARMSAQLLFHPAVVAHHDIEKAEIAAAGSRVGMIRRKGIE